MLSMPPPAVSRVRRLSSRCVNRANEAKAARSAVSRAWESRERSQGRQIGSRSNGASRPGPDERSQCSDPTAEDSDEANKVDRRTARTNPSRPDGAWEARTNPSPDDGDARGKNVKTKPTAI